MAESGENSSKADERVWPYQQVEKDVGI